MIAVQFLVNEVFDIAARSGLVAVGTTRNGEFVGIPTLRDDTTGHPIHVLGVDHPSPRTQVTGETILLVDRADAEYVRPGRLWTQD
jgi:hypothetical protein